MIEKPLLSGKAPDDPKRLRYPLLASPKLDGIRCLTLPPDREGAKCRAVTRKLKPVPNTYTRELIESTLPPGLDGELMLDDWTAEFRLVSSAIMSRSGMPNFNYALFDCVPDQGPDLAFGTRYDTLEWVVGSKMPECQDWLYRVRQIEIGTPEGLVAYYEQCLDQGFEGIMVRDPAGRYKFGRSTVKEGLLLKIKPWEDEEATVIGIVEQMHNENELQQDELGHAKRSTAKAGLVPMGTMGALRCQFDDGTEFEVGTGFSHQQRQDIWRDWKRHLKHLEGLGGGISGWRVAKIGHQPPPGGRKPGQAPRFPKFLGWRED